jgi:hypothetical protein
VGSDTEPALEANLSRGLPGAVGRYKGLLLYFALAALMTSTCLRIEYLNWRAGGVMPRHEYRDNDPKEGLVTWRSSGILNEKNWRKVNLRGDNGAPLARPLTPQEQKQMNEDLESARYNNALLEVVSSWGMLQYLLAPLVSLGSLALLAAGKPPRGVRAGAAIVLALALLSVASMLYRGYFTCLD